MRRTPIAAVLGLLVCISLSASAQSGWRALDDASKLCGVDLDRAADGVYARTRGKQWQQFKDVKAVPKESDREMAQYWRGERGSLVQMATRQSGFIRYHEFCFDAEGKLTRLTYELRSSEGWGYAMTGTLNESGRLKADSSRFFGLRTKRTIPRPPQAQQEAWVLNPKIYRRLDKLPFAKLLGTPVEQTKEDAQAH